MPSFALFLNLLLTVQQGVAPSVNPAPTGLEWMIVASVVAPAVLLVVLVYLGGKTTR